MSYTNLTLYRKFYLMYPHLSSITGKFAPLRENLQAPPEDFEEQTLPAEMLINKLTFTHFVELLKVENPLKRLFFEIECIKGNWNYRQLQRQIGSLLYERTGLSRNKEALLAQIKDDNSPIHDAGQMNFYLNYHRENLMAEDDNPPVGIILCSYKNEAVVRYATGSLDTQLFVSRYLLQLPDEETLRNFLIQEKRLLGDIE